MIDKATFSAALAVLAGAFGREVDAGVSVAYYRVLSRRLTTEEFERAVSTVIETEKFWPSPAVLLAAARPKDDARIALGALIAQLRDKGGFQFFPHASFQALTPEVKAGIKAVGGLREITMASAKDMPTLERQFARAYNAERRELPPGGRDRQLPREVHHD